VLVDFGEVNYNVLPLAVKQFHRVAAIKTDETGENHIIFATRHQFALDSGYIEVPLHAVINIVKGGVPRPYRAQRLGIDGSIHFTNEFFQSTAVLSVRTMTQTIVVQFEGEFECRQWHALIQEAVRLRPVDVHDL
jgi:hypothetical protein